eukprot:3394663-Pyramimonas_sp.AAC.1
MCIRDRTAEEDYLTAEGVYLTAEEVYLTAEEVYLTAERACLYGNRDPELGVRRRRRDISKGGGSELFSGRTACEGKRSPTARGATYQERPRALLDGGGDLLHLCVAHRAGQDQLREAIDAPSGEFKAHRGEFAGRPGPAARGNRRTQRRVRGSKGEIEAQGGAVWSGEEAEEGLGTDCRLRIELYTPVTIDSDVQQASKELGSVRRDAWSGNRNFSAVGPLETPVYCGAADC